MSFLRGRLGAIEKSYFKKEDEFVAAKLKKKLEEKNAVLNSNQKSSPVNAHSFAEASVDVLPEILQHSSKLSAPLETNLIREPLVRRHVEDMDKKVADSVVKSTLQPFGHIPETRLGRSKYTLDVPKPIPSVPSTANELRVVPADKTKIKNLMKGLTQVSKAFGIATLVVYGGGIFATWMAFNALGVTNMEDIPEKVKQKLKPSIEKGKERIEPLQQWLKSKAENWRIKEEDRIFIGSKLAKSLGVKVSNSNDSVES